MLRQLGRTLRGMEVEWVVELVVMALESRCCRLGLQTSRRLEDHFLQVTLASLPLYQPIVLLT